MFTPSFCLFCLFLHLISFFFSIQHWDFAPLHMKSRFCKMELSTSAPQNVTVGFMAPLCCSATSPPPLSQKRGWWRIVLVLNINTALASITKASAINTEEWSQPGLKFNRGHSNHQALLTQSFGAFLFCRLKNEHYCNQDCCSSQPCLSQFLFLFVFYSFLSFCLCQLLSFLKGQWFAIPFVEES